MVRVSAIIFASWFSLTALPEAAPAAMPSPALRQRLSQIVQPEFEFFGWSPHFHAVPGLIHDDRPEPCSFEVVKLQKQASAETENPSARRRLGWLLNRHGTPGSGNIWLAEAARICRERLKTAPQDEEALVELALLYAGTEEAGAAARKAAEAHPNSWRAWDALARHELRRMEQRLLGNLPTTPQELAAADFPRLEAILRAHAEDADFAAILYDIDRQREASAKRAVAAAPDQVEPLLNYIHGRLAAAVIVPAVRRLRNEQVQDRPEFDKETLRLLDQAAALAKEDPQLLGIIGFVQVQTKIAMAEAAAARRARPQPAGAPIKPPPRPKVDERTLPVLVRLRELAQGEDDVRASAAAEAYGALLALINLSGGEPPAAPTLPDLLSLATERAPLRPLLWDLRLGLYFTGTLRPPFANDNDPLSVAKQRLRHLPTGRSHAMVAYASNGEAARLSWIEAAKLEPSNIEFLLNLAAAFLAAGHTPENIETAVALVQRATELGYNDFSWQKPRLEAFRLRMYAVCLILKGEDERAHGLLIERLREFPGDIASREIRDALVSE
jgi:hypothetical protein